MRMLIRKDKDFSHDASIIQTLVFKGFVTGELKVGSQQRTLPKRSTYTTTSPTPGCTRSMWYIVAWRWWHAGRYEPILRSQQEKTLMTMRNNMVPPPHTGVVGGAFLAASVVELCVPFLARNIYNKVCFLLFPQNQRFYA